MLNRQDNDLITRIDRDSPMGALMRQYWVPALLSSELPQPDCDPIRVLLLGERLIAFRASDGRVGLIQNNCPHRGASLFFGRNEEGGLRCVYHGWKFDVTGQCVDMPNEPAESNFKSKVKATAYPCQERGGVVWAYLGTRAVPPALPNLEANMDAAAEARAVQRECNWLQGLEGDIDTSHAGFLHYGALRDEDLSVGTFAYYLNRERAPRFSVVDTEAGVMSGAYRDAQPGYTYWRFAQFMFPFYTIPAPGVLGLPVVTQAWVPMDNTHFLLFRLYPGSIARQRPSASGGTEELLPNTTDWLGRFRLEANFSNDFQLDRDLQRTGGGAGGYSGITGIMAQDQAVTESMGGIYDRSTEHLGTTDAMIIRVRRRLLDAARALTDHHQAPPAVDDPDAYLMRGGGVILPKDVDWIEGTRGLREPRSVHPELDMSMEGRQRAARQPSS